MLIECNIFVVEIDSEDKRKGIEIKKSKKKKRQIVEKYSNAMLLLLFITHRKKITKDGFSQQMMTIHTILLCINTIRIYQ